LLDDKELEKIISETDQNDDGMIDYKEFLEMMKNNESFKEAIST